MNRDEQIRLRAHELWEREGRPEGRHGAHWEQASREIGMAEETGVAGPPTGTPQAPLRDADTGEALAADPSGWQPPAERAEPAAGKGGTGVIVAAEPGEGGTGATPARGGAARGRRKPPLA